MSYETTVVLYFAIFFASICFICEGSKRLNKGKYFNLFVVIGLALPILLAGMRYWVGADWGTYYNQFIRAQTQSWGSVFEDGLWGWLIFLIRKVTALTGNYRIYFGVLSTLAVVPVYMAFVKYNKNNIGIMMFLYYTMHFLYSFNIGKQYIAVAITLCAYNYIFEANYKKYFALIVLATMFHPSGFLALPAYFLWNPKQQKIVSSWKIWILFFIYLLFVLNFQNIMGVFTEVTSMDRYSVYTTTDTRGSNNSLYLKLMIFGIEALFYKHLVRIDPRNKLFFVLQLLDLIISFTGFSSTQLKRSGIYYSITNIYLLSTLPYVVVKHQRLQAKLLVAAYGLAYCILIFYILEQGHSMPYRINETSFTEIMEQINQTKLFGN